MILLFTTRCFWTSFSNVALSDPSFHHSIPPRSRTCCTPREHPITPLSFGPFFSCLGMWNYTCGRHLTFLSATRLMRVATHSQRQRHNPSPSPPPPFWSHDSSTQVMVVPTKGVFDSRGRNPGIIRDIIAYSGSIETFCHPSSWQS